MPADDALNAAGAAYYLDELREHVRQGIDAMRDARRYGASPDEVIEAVASGADQEASSIPLMARMAMRRAIESV